MEILHEAMSSARGEAEGTNMPNVIYPLANSISILLGPETKVRDINNIYILLTFLFCKYTQSLANK